MKSKIEFLCLILIILFQSAQSQISNNKNLISNPGFELADQSTKLPSEWSSKSSREEIAPAFMLDRTLFHSGKSSMKISGKGSKGTFGYILSAPVAINQKGSSGFSIGKESLRDTSFLGNKNYRVSCYFKTKDISSISKNIWIRLNWLDKNNGSVFTELVSGNRKENDWYKAEQVVTAPKAAAYLNIELALQWTATGTVWWDDVSVEEISAKPGRQITAGTSCTSPPAPSTPDKNREFYANAVLEAGKQGIDILCLGEGITVVATGKSYADVAETIPGPTTRILGEAAKKSRLYVVAGIYEREGSLIYNTAIVIDRNGNIAGKYRKTHLPETEVYGGLTPGDSYPVFQTDFGKIGIEICYDNFFPEVARSLTLNGAEVIMVPIWGDPREQESVWDIVARTRAIDNSVYLVASMYNRHSGLIFSPYGKILDNGSPLNGLLSAKIMLDTRTFEPWLSVYSYGDWKNLFRQERRSETYQGLFKPADN